MENKVTICAEIDWVFEGCQLFEGLLSDRTLEEFKEAVFVKYGLNTEYSRKCILLLEQMEADARETFADEAEQIGRYFREFLPDTPLVDFILCCDTDKERSCVTVERLTAHYDALTAQQRDAFFYKEMVRDIEPEEFRKVIGCEKEGIVVSEVERMRRILCEIRKLDLSLEKKVLLEDVYLNRDACFKEITALLERAVTFLQGYEPQMRALCEPWEKYWTKIVEEQHFEEIMQHFNVKFEDMERGVYLCPSIIQCATLRISIDGGVIPREKKLLPAWQIGLLLNEDFGPSSEMKEEYQTEWLLKSLKAISDQSKYDILLYIKEKPSYGSEIAKQFSLTTATVSHHMNRLLGLGLISVEQRNGKVYYQTNRAEMRKLFDACKEILG